MSPESNSGRLTVTLQRFQRRLTVELSRPDLIDLDDVALLLYIIIKKMIGNKKIKIKATRSSPYGASQMRDDFIGRYNKKQEL
jgi:hypothetical protein